MRHYKARSLLPEPQAGDPGSAEARADLEQLFAVRDADFRRHAAGEATQPMFLRTEPAKL